MEELIAEKKLAERMGLKLADLAAIRKKRLQAKTDWAYQNDEVVYSESGLEKIAALLKTPQEPAKPTGETTLVIVRTNIIKTTAVLCVKKGAEQDGIVCLVGLLNKDKYRCNDELKARELDIEVWERVDAQVWRPTGEQPGAGKWVTIR